jgi:uncharacterized OB-fold protein
LSFLQAKRGKNSFVSARCDDHHSHTPATTRHEDFMIHPDPLWSTEPPARLLASRHHATGALRFPAFRPGSELAAQHEVVPLAGRGTVYSFTVIHPSPKSGAAPFALGYVDLPGPVRIFGRIAGEGLRIGAACEAVPDAANGYAFQITTAGGK